MRIVPLIVVVVREYNLPRRTQPVRTPRAEGGAGIFSPTPFRSEVVQRHVRK